MTVIYASFGRPPLHEPSDPDFVSMIIYAKDHSDEDLSWREIASIVGDMFGCRLSHMGARYHYARWRDWYHAQP
jgi:hypothetical protein